MKELCLTIPCETGKFAENEPIHIFIGEDSTGAAQSQWQCPHCKRTFFRRKPCTHHMGLVMNIPAGCPVLKAQDEARRKELRKWLEETREIVYEKLSDELFYLREQAKLNRQDL